MTLQAVYKNRQKLKVEGMGLCRFTQVKRTGL